MHAKHDRWEHGSDFHCVAIEPAQCPEQVPWGRGILFGSGRDALRSVVQHGRAARGWVRIWLPDYLCGEVVAAVLGTGIEVAFYRDDPLAPQACWPGTVADTDVTLWVNYFGLRSSHHTERPPRGELIEDHTHDPVSPRAEISIADYCVASLRKTIPVPDGGALWSPRGRDLPCEPAVTRQREHASADRRLAMSLKARYLHGDAVAKSAYRELARRGEAAIADGDVSGMPLSTRAALASFPYRRWRGLRALGFEAMARTLRGAPGMRVLYPADRDCVPHALVAYFETVQLRETVRARLIDANIYPAVLWNLDGTHANVSARSLDVSRRVMSLHCDGRYDDDDLIVVATALRGIVQAVSG